MTNRRRLLLGTGAAVGALALARAPLAAEAAKPPGDVLRDWYRLVLKLVRHTATYSPPVASRSFAYLGVAAYEAAAAGSAGLKSLAGQLSGLTPVPPRQTGQAYDDSIVIHAAMRAAVNGFFGNTGPTGQRVMKAVGDKMEAIVTAGIDPAVAVRSGAYGRSIAEHIIAWSVSDGCGPVENMGFPALWTVSGEPGHWTPTSTIAQQQAPLLPGWGKLRGFAMPSGASCGLPPPPAYSDDPASEFYAQAMEVRDVRKALTDEQRIIARFWSDDPMLSPTPPGHWISIAMQILDAKKAGLEESADLLARLGVTVADAFIACWDAKFNYDLIRPVTYIRKHIDPKFEPLLITPPFPEYPSGHSTQSGAAAAVLTAFYGENFAFSDATHERDGLKARSYESFWEAAEEAGISRLYGGIHFRAAVERGLDQGRCVGAFAVNLKTRAAA
jgi:hypothetical protein